MGRLLRADRLAVDLLRAELDHDAAESTADRERAAVALAAVDHARAATYGWTVAPDYAPAAG